MIEKVFFEVALAINGLLALLVAYCYLFKRETAWPVVRWLILKLLKG